MSEAMNEIAALLEMRMGDAVVSHKLAFGELTVTTTPTHLVKLIRHLQIDESMRFSTLVDITGVDYPGRRKRFEVVYHFLSMYLNQRIRVKLAVGEDEIIPSITQVHPSANWFEREVFDMFGILFSGHPDLRRILTDYGFRGHPLRKDFPTTGYTEVRYDEALKRVVYEPVNLVQEYRQFDFMSPWEGAEYILPGDEKTEAAK
ncbi:NADH-quinone oxidoreductase subunit C [Natronohydrobacter thiooxidans]|jgi:NADH-quinone oxidoreductase subunit C|uniref:NADH-quinone oxidoreductase subunit C n=1 Tax=Natronohydrobacter thiooxidans TaxID=87172 RepID=UPI0008FF4F03|nr:NADH-quinone oxidoreductase subunit C [Natronohydrobacter thiooxidans]